MMNQTPIFETLAPGEVYILNIIDGCFEYIANIDGEAMLKQTSRNNEPPA